MKKNELAKRIITDTEGFETAHVNDFNRAVLEELNHTEFRGEVDDEAVEKLEELLKAFLLKTWADEPLAHKYVIGSCLARAFLFEKPMHPKDRVNYVERVENGKRRYYCSYHEINTLCDYCAAASMEELAGPVMGEGCMEA